MSSATGSHTLLVFVGWKSREEVVCIMLYVRFG